MCKMEITPDIHKSIVAVAAGSFPRRHAPVLTGLLQFNYQMYKYEAGIRAAERAPCNAGGKSSIPDALERPAFD